MNSENKPQNDSSVIVCPSCEQPARRSQTMVKQNGQIAVGHGPCEQCQSTLLSIEMNTERMKAVIGVLTDLQRDEVEKFWNGRRISADDVIDVHAALRNTVTLKKKL